LHGEFEGVDVRFYLSEVLVFFGFLCLFAVGLEPTSLAQMKEIAA
jgi:hypothetical protein